VVVYFLSAPIDIFDGALPLEAVLPLLFEHADGLHEAEHFEAVTDWIERALDHAADTTAWDGHGQVWFSTIPNVETCAMQWYLVVKAESDGFTWLVSDREIPVFGTPIQEGPASASTRPRQRAKGHLLPMKRQLESFGTLAAPS
jgi:hypothetical protein